MDQGDGPRACDERARALNWGLLVGDWDPRETFTIFPKVLKVVVAASLIFGQKDGTILAIPINLRTNT